MWGWGGPGGCPGFPPDPGSRCSRALLAAAVPEVLLQTDLRPGRPSLQPAQSPPRSRAPTLWEPPRDRLPPFQRPELQPAA